VADQESCVAEVARLQAFAEMPQILAIRLLFSAVCNLHRGAGIDKSNRKTTGGQRMKGVQFVVDEKGNKTAVVIDLKKNPELWEDFYDRALAHEREDEPRETLQSLKDRLGRKGKRKNG
jgi:hypothetical protein